MKTKVLVASVLMLMLLSLSAIAQSSSVQTPALAPSSSRVVTDELYSTLMGRKMPYRVILPANYSTKDGAARRYPVLYLLHGLTGHYDNWTNLTKVVDYSAAYDLIIVMPEGENGWYTDNFSKEGDKFESYIIKELLPKIATHYRTHHQTAIAGLSMGGYGAIKLGLKYPEIFELAGSFSGAIGAASITEKDFPGAIGRSIDAIFGPIGSSARRSNDLFFLIRNATTEQIKRFPYLYLDCGTEDFLFQNNRDFVTLLLEKNVPHEFRQLPGGHNWKYWDARIEEFLRFATRHLERSAQLRHSGTNIETITPIALPQTPAFFTSGVPQISSTTVRDRNAARMLLGQHMFSLQWVSWDHFGVATVRNNHGMFTIAGEQRGRGSSKGNYVTIDGVITSIDAKEFGFRGKIVTHVDHINGGEPCVRDGDFTFKITGKRRYWRLQQMDNPCDPVTDYVDVYFR